ncbi:MAG TPA: GRP family sugar transporter [Alloacidobacterium sp.]|jgi:glucose uptake protein|nr:GRP family sugar transporter [Alloacidobacterium sp.]
MYQPEIYGIVLSFMIISMFCWGSWANTLKLCPKFRFQLYYWDYVIGLLLGACIWGLTLGSFGSTGQRFLVDIASASSRTFLLAFMGGVVFNVANLLLVAAIDIAGLAVAFPIGIGLALVVGAVSSYLITPKGNPLLLFGGIALVVAAIAFDAIAYRIREANKAAMSRRGIVISLIAGVLMGCFYPCVSAAMTGADPVGPYAAVLFLALGVLVCAIPFNWLLMRKPLDGGRATSIGEYFQAPVSFHFWGVLGGAIWCTGTVLNFVSSQAHIVGPAVSYSIGQGATMISACWGVFVWREFATAPSPSRIFLAWMFVLFLSGLTAVAVAPLFS